MRLAVPNAPFIGVLAGVNGAGKSSLGGALVRGAGVEYFNPDEAARQIRHARGCASDVANSIAWEEGKRRLEAAISSRISYVFESTLGGRTIPALLVKAAQSGI